MVPVMKRYCRESLWSALCESSDVMSLSYHISYDTMNKSNSKANKQLGIIQHKLSFSLH